MQKIKSINTTAALASIIFVVLILCFSVWMTMQNTMGLQSTDEASVLESPNQEPKFNSGSVQNLPTPIPGLSNDSRPEAATLISSREGFDALVENQRFSLLVARPDDDRLVEMRVISREEKPSYTQIEGLGDKGTALIVFTEETTRIYLKVAGQMYSFTGPDFDGRVPRMKIYPVNDKVVYPELDREEIKPKPREYNLTKVN